MTVGSATAGAGTTRDGIDRRTFVLLGTVVAVDADATGAVLLERLAAHLEPFARVAAPGPPDHTFAVAAGAGGAATVISNGTVVAHGSWPHVEAVLLARLNAAAIAGYRGLAVHAGVVALGRRVVCFPGASGAGKSTITAACLGAGFAYVSDEALCVDRATRRVDPYPRPLALSTASCDLLGLPVPVIAGDDGDGDGDGRRDEREVILTAGELGAPALGADHVLELGDVVELQRGASELHLEPVHRARAVPALLSMSFNHFKEPDTTVEVVGALARDVRVWRLHYGDPLAAAALLARELA